MWFCKIARLCETCDLNTILFVWAKKRTDLNIDGENEPIIRASEPLSIQLSITHRLTKNWLWLPGDCPLSDPDDLAVLGDRGQPGRGMRPPLLRLVSSGRAAAQVRRSESKGRGWTAAAGGPRQRGHGHHTRVTLLTVNAILAYLYLSNHLIYSAEKWWKHEWFIS